MYDSLVGYLRENDLKLTSRLLKAETGRSADNWTDSEIAIARAHLVHLEVQAHKGRFDESNALPISMIPIEELRRRFINLRKAGKLSEKS